MNSKKEINLADIFDAAFAPLFRGPAKKRVREPVIDVESDFVPSRSSMPMPVKAIFNLKTEDMVPVLDENGEPVWESAGENQPKRKLKQAKTLEKPILASKVFFEDGSWTVVKNSGEDTVDIEEKALPDGRTVKVATAASKERAIAYAVVKRAFGSVSATGEVKGANLGRKFDKVLANSVDQNAGNIAVKTENPEESEPKKQKPKGKCSCRRLDAQKLENLLKIVSGAVEELAKKNDFADSSEKPQEGA